MTRTTKNERKYGKKIDKVAVKKSRKREIKSKPEVEMFKILIDGSGFTRPMTHEACLQYIAKAEKKAKKFNQKIPNLVLVKQ